MCFQKKSVDRIGKRKRLKKLALPQLVGKMLNIKDEKKLGNRFFRHESVKWDWKVIFHKRSPA